jgi:protein-S-isoprenylcysteine O-methyltransferase Ste14
MPRSGPRRAFAPALTAWAGAAVFFVALLWAVYAYAIGFDRRAVRLSAPAAIAFNVAVFSVFALHHSLLARAGAKRRVMSWTGPELERSVYTWIASLLFITVCAWWEPVPGTIYALTGPGRLLAYGVQIAGVLLTIRASAALDMLELAGVRQVQHAGAGTSARTTTLETGGLYGVVRHPLYAAWALMVFGAPDMTATRATFAIVSTMYLVAAIPWEERSLARTFGPAYDEYRRQVRWRMIPWVY